MTPRMRNRIGLILILALFATPLVTAYVLNAFGWRPSGMRNYGELIEPAQDLTTAHFVLADGTSLGWKNEDWSWTIFAITGPGCAQKCLARVDELRRARLTLNQNTFRVRIVVLDDSLTNEVLAPLAPVARGRDADAKLAALRPAEADAVAVAFADPHGFLVLRYPVGYDANLLRKDLARVIKG
jgi:hypothetical protein